jgi:hypothetical protein
MKLSKAQVFARLDKYDWTILAGTIATVVCINGKEIMGVTLERDTCTRTVAEEATDKDSVRS